MRHAEGTMKELIFGVDYYPEYMKEDRTGQETDRTDKQGQAEIAQDGRHNRAEMTKDQGDQQNAAGPEGQAFDGYVAEQITEGNNTEDGNQIIHGRFLASWVCLPEPVSWRHVHYYYSKVYKYT